MDTTTEAATKRKVDSFFAQMTLEEKLDMLGGTGFATKLNVRLGIPELKMTDGPVGVR
jgi:beta-glucosidase